MNVAVRERLQYEMGIKANPRYFNTFSYRAEFEYGLTENEIDHIYIAACNDNPKPDPEEVMDWAWMKPLDIVNDLTLNREKYTVWFPYIIEKILGRILNQSQTEPDNGI
jgi:isopentenyl-diphosphate delta-isomerase